MWTLEGRQVRCDLQVQDLLQLEGQKLPNLTHPESPVGSEEAAVELQSIGQQPAFSFQPRDHLQLGQHLDLFDFDSAAEVAGEDAILAQARPVPDQD